MINHHYREQLDYLRNLAKEFTKKHPALAPMLAGQNADPDVERLLEGTAFLSGIVKERLDDDFPELIHGLTQLLFPHYLRPLPSATIMQFTPKASLSETLKVKKGTTINSNPVDGHSCTFSTCADVELHPLGIDNVEWLHGNAGQACLRIHFTLSGLLLKDWRPKSLRFHLPGSYVEASHRYAFLCQHLKDVRVNCGSMTYRIGKTKFQSLIDRDELPLLDYPSNSFPAFRVLQEYYMLPQKFLFFDVVDFARWGEAEDAQQFSIDFLIETQHELPTFTADHIELHCVPAVNLFDGEADSIHLDHQKAEYKLRASRSQDHIYSLDKVVGFQQGTVIARDYRPFEMFNPNSENIPVYSLRRRPNKLSKGSSLYLSVAYPQESPHLRQETLSVTVRCTNGHLPEEIQYGDICKATETSPEMATFKNILTPTKPVEPPLGDNTLWRLISHLYLNQLTLCEPEHLMALLKLYIFTDSRDRAKVQANTKRADSISTLSSQRRRRLFQGAMISGVDINVSLNPDSFPGKGDMFVFSAVLKHLLSSFSAINCFTQLTFENMNTKERYQWPPQVGQRQLM
ncbi:type VI secretion system baseplate subunit TssF [Vibrio sp. S4M6]|uniref:type VI secretion system baseplate subunit TssF n=1 Tax=Vibrio sinus TaxID=2946865 RepID=UPI00202A2FBD|nr:type VI secretion system baseplate subunit TssF [Vibrio sinus]MCL9782503.1 type VI secretion system baseplate subunit TssF [Vibrio sinus]